MLHVYPVVADEPPAVLVERQAKLRTAVGRLDHARVRLKADVGPAHFNRFLVGREGRADLAPRQSAGDINPIVDAQRRMAAAELCAAGRAQAGEHDAPHVGPAVAVAVGQEQHLGGTGDQQSVAPRHQTVRKREPGGKIGPRVVLAVAVAIFEQRDPPQRRLAGGGPGRIATILGHEQPAAGVEGQRTRAFHQRLDGHELQSQPRLDDKVLQDVVSFGGGPRVRRRKQCAECAHGGQQHDWAQGGGAITAAERNESHGGRAICSLELGLQDTVFWAPARPTATSTRSGALGRSEGNRIRGRPQGAAAGGLNRVQ